MSTSTFPLLLLLIGASAGAQVPALYEGADLKLGERLIAEHKCAACHRQKVGGDGSAIYRPAGRVNTPGVLRGMVLTWSGMTTSRFRPKSIRRRGSSRDAIRMPRVSPARL